MRRCFPKRNGEKGSKTTCPIRARDPDANTKMQADHSVPSSSWKHKRNQPANVRGTSKAARSPSRRRPWDSARPVNRTTPRISTKSVRPRGHTIDRIGLARTRGVPNAGRQGSKGGSCTRPDPTRPQERCAHAPEDARTVHTRKNAFPSHICHASIEFILPVALPSGIHEVHPFPCQ